MDIVEKNTVKIKSLCEKYKVSKLYVFGSVISSHFTKESDIDFLVMFDNVGLQDYADNYFDFKFSLQDLFNRKIDLIEEKAIKNPYFKRSVDNSKRLIL